MTSFLDNAIPAFAVLAGVILYFAAVDFAAKHFWRWWHRR